MSRASPRNKPCADARADDPSASTPANEPSAARDQKPWPKYCSRRRAVELIAEHRGVEYSPRTLERWPMRRLLVNGKSIMETEDVFAYVDDEIAKAVKIA